MKEPPSIQNKVLAANVEQRKVYPILINDDGVKSKSGIVTYLLQGIFSIKINEHMYIHVDYLAYSPGATIDSSDFANVYKGQWLNDKV